LENSEDGYELCIFDGSMRRRIEGEEFQRALLSVWLGPAPPNAELKKGIVGR
jgi:hypothetical protein